MRWRPHSNVSPPPPHKPSSGCGDRRIRIWSNTYLDKYAKPEYEIGFPGVLELVKELNNLWFR